MDFFGFRLFGSLCVSWTWMSVSSRRLGKFSAITYSSKISVPLSISSGLLLVCLMLPQRTLILIFKNSFFFSCFIWVISNTLSLPPCSNFHLPVLPPPCLHWSILLYHPICCLWGLAMTVLGTLVVGLPLQGGSWWWGSSPGWGCLQDVMGLEPLGVEQHWSGPKSSASTVGWEPFWRGAFQSGQVA